MSRLDAYADSDRLALRELPFLTVDDLARLRRDCFDVADAVTARELEACEVLDRG